MFAHRSSPCTRARSRHAEWPVLECATTIGLRASLRFLSSFGMTSWKRRNCRDSKTSSAEQGSGRSWYHMATLFPLSAGASFVIPSEVCAVRNLSDVLHTDHRHVREHESWHAEWPVLECATTIGVRASLRFLSSFGMTSWKASKCRNSRRSPESEEFRLAP